MGSIEILWGLAGVATATLYAGWFGMRVERRHRPALILFMTGSVPLVAIDLAWCAVTTEPFGSRLIVSGLIGAFTGACLLIGATESLRWLVTGAEAQSTTQGQPSPSINAPNNRGIVTQGQSGGQNTVNNFGSPEPHITPAQNDKFVHVANGHGEKVAIRLQDGSNPGRTYYQEVIELFNNAKYQAVGTDGANTLPGKYTGLVIEVGSPMPASAATIASAFDQAGIPYQVVRGPWSDGTPDMYRLVIWPAQ